MLHRQHKVKHFYFTPTLFRLYCNNIIIPYRARARTHPGL
nr:MAG TPA: hypothetical protein [Bacteriophage sp.]